MKSLTIIVLLVAFSANTFSQTAKFVSIEGHRGARGYLPENTVPSFIKALEQGADTIELDVVISSDGKVVVSHEPWFSSVISLDPKGNRIAKENEREHNIFKMNYAKIKKYDVGGIGNIGFPEQIKLKVYKPLMSDVFKAVERHAQDKKLRPVRYNIEIKSNPESDGVFHPAPRAFAKLVTDEVARHKLEDQVIIQSFDVRPLQEIKEASPTITLALLVSNKDGIKKNLERLGFSPDTYSPHFSLVDTPLAEYCRKNGLKLVPWTVNEIADLERMKTFDFDGIITDYPDRAVRIFRK